MLDAVELSKPVLPRTPCPRHEPERVSNLYVRRASVPCPECYLGQPNAPKRYEKLLSRPVAEPGPREFGLRVTVNLEAKAVYEPQHVLGRTCWRLVDVKAPDKKKAS